MRMIDFYRKLETLVDEGDEKGAAHFIGEYFYELPEETKAEVLTRLYFEAKADEAEELKAAERVQKEGIEAMRLLEMLKRQVEKEDSKV